MANAKRTPPAHTPGPWAVGTSGITVITPAYSFSVQSEADVRLLAAAPDQHETLEAIRNDCEAWLHDEMDMPAEDLLAAIRSAAETAIAKATSQAA